MKNKKNRFWSLMAMTLSAVIFVTACGKDDDKGGTFTEEDYVGTYFGSHVISDPFLLNVITTIDPEQDGSFPDTILVGTGPSTTDNIMEFTSTLLNGVTIEANISITSGGNVIAKEFGTLSLGSEDPIEVTNAQVRQSSSIRPSGGNTFNARLNMAGTIEIGGGTPINLSNIQTQGVFVK